MSDQELRNKLAFQYAKEDFAADWAEALDSFKAGWDAARANPLVQTVNLNAQGLEATVKGTVDQLRAEVERLKREIERRK